VPAATPQAKPVSRLRQALCAPMGLPRLIVDGRFSHAR